MKIKEIKYRNLKLFWTEKVDKFLIDGLKGGHDYVDKINDKDWREVLWEKDTVEDVKKYGLKVFGEIWGSGSYFSEYSASLSAEEKSKHQEAENKDNEEEQMLTKLEDEKNAFQKLAKDYETDIKNIIGSDELTEWNKKVVKADIKDKDILNLQTKVADLTKLKEEAEKQLKEKQQQILNHRCDTPNNTELNKTKDELVKANKEITSLKEQLEKKPNNPNPSPTSPNDKEEEKENNNLNLEQLKEKLTARRQEIENLKKELEKSKQNGSYSNQNNNQNSKFLLGMATGLAIMAVMGGIIYFARLYLAKKKKKNKGVRNLVVKISNGKLNRFKL